jgi:transposase-like protein
MQPSAPETLLEAIRYFADPDICLEFMVAIRWPSGITCPRCASGRYSFLRTRRIWKCLECKKQFSVKVGTIFEDSPIGLDKWLPCLWMLVNCKNGVSSYEISRAIDVTQKTAWFMLHRIRLAMQTDTFDKFGGQVEADETYIGGAARFMHKARRQRVLQPGKTTKLGKVAVMGLLERHGPDGHSRVRASVIPNAKRHIVQPKVRENVTPGAEVFTDALLSYQGLDADYIHAVIDHSETYVQGKVHTNGMENFWSLFKRAIKGTYVAIEPFHLFRYLDEQVYRFNARKGNDGSRFREVLTNIFNKRVTYAALIGRHLPETC